MHVAKQLKSENLQIKICDSNATLNDIFPEPNHNDRYGFIVNQPYGGLGASLLIQAAIVHFYDFRPARRDTEPMYPEIYMFHVGGRFGDHSSFDFWPPRKEVFVESGNPAKLLSEIADRGITRLAVPEVHPGRLDSLQDGPSSFADIGAVRNCLASCFVYNSRSQTDDADVFLESDHDTFEVNSEWALNTDIILDRYRYNPEDIYRPGPTSHSDIDYWVNTIQSRDAEVDDSYGKKLLSERRQAEGDRLIRRESFRRIDLDQTFELLAGL